MKNLLMKIRGKKYIALIVAIALIGFGTYWFAQSENKKKQTQVQEVVVQVKRGDIRFSVSGTSQLEPRDTQLLSAPEDATIKAINLTRNMPVKKDDLLVELSDPLLESDMESAKLQLQQLENDLADLQDQMNALTLKSPIAGKLTYANNIDAGVQVNKTTKIGTIADTTMLTVKLPFVLEEGVLLKKGDPLELTIDGFLLTKAGTVHSVGKVPYSDGKGGKWIDVEANISNDATLDAGLIAKASAAVGGRTISSKTGAPLQYNQTVTLLANVSGTIERMDIKNGTYVQKTDTLLRIVSETIVNDFQKKQLEVENQKLKIQNLQEKIDALKIKAPFDGVYSTDFVDKKNNILTGLTPGTKVSSGKQFGGVASLEYMQLPIQVDELDLPLIKTGMQALVRIDSIPNRTFPAEVSQVSSVGTTTNGVTFFDVVLSLKNDGELKYGLTGTGEILVQDKKDVLYIPIEALQRQRNQYFVALKRPDGTIESQHEVKIGIRSKTQVEIVQGLKEGEQIVIAQGQNQKMNPQDVQRLRQQFQQGGQGGQGIPGGAGGLPGQGGRTPQGGGQNRGSGGSSGQGGGGR